MKKKVATFAACLAACLGVYMLFAAGSTSTDQDLKIGDEFQNTLDMFIAPEG